MAVDDNAAPGGISLVVQRTIRASAQALFAAWTEPMHLQRWWGPSTVVCTAAEVDLRVGGRYRIANRLPDGTVLWIAGVFERVEPPELLVFSWTIEGREQAAERVSVRFTPRGETTDVTVIHDRIADDATRSSHDAGWHGCLDGLARYLAPGEG